MSEPEDTSFARLVSLACHDLRTPLATVHGFVRTLPRLQDFSEPAARYLQMMDAASKQMATLLDALGLAARIASGRYEPVVREVSTLELARAAAEQVGGGAVVVSGRGGSVETDSEAAARALADVSLCLLRHGGLERVELEAEGSQLSLVPVPAAIAPIVLGDDLRDLGAAIAGRVVEALGGSLELEGETLRLRLPLASATRA
jgi:signal transduction histidine kinase